MKIELTASFVKTYQDIYYDVYKPLFKQMGPGSDFQKAFSLELKKVNWTRRLFEEVRSIDFMQRLVFDYSHELVISGHRKEPFTSMPDYRCYDPNYGALRLKCPVRTEDKDVLN